MIFGKKLKSLRRERKLTQKELAAFLNISHSNISKYESESLEPNLEIINNIAEFFEVTTDYLLGKSASVISEQKAKYKAGGLAKVPIIKSTQTEKCLLSENNIIGYSHVDTGFNLENEAFLLEVGDDSMELSHLVKGHHVLVHRQEHATNGDIMVVAVDRERELIRKVYKYANSTMILIPNSSNPHYSPRVIDLKSAEVNFVGKVIQSIINL